MTIYIDTTVALEPYEILDEMDDDYLVDELKSRGWEISGKYSIIETNLDKTDIAWLKELILENCDLPNDIEAYNVYEKLRTL